MLSTSDTYINPPETGFYYQKSRYYDPETGRFINADGYVSTGQGLLGCNMYLYCGNNSVNRTDSTGTKWWKNLKKKAKKALGSLQSWMKNLIGLEKRRSKNTSYGLPQTMPGCKNTFGIRTTDKIKGKSGIITCYKSMNSDGNSEVQKVMYGISNILTGTDISLGEEGYSYSKNYNSIFGEMYVNFSIDLDMTISYELGAVQAWDYGEVEC